MGLVLLAFVLMLPASQAQASPSAGMLLTPLETLLEPDGSLNLNTGFSGSADVKGWTMTTAADGAPRFVRTGGDSAGAPLSIPGDERWDAQFAPQGTDGTVLAMAVKGTDVYVGGLFHTAGGVPANHVAKWSTPAHTWSSLGVGLNNGVEGGSINALVVNGSDLYVGGGFDTAGGIPAYHVAKWSTTTQTWSALGGGVGFFVRALAVKGTQLYAGGEYAGCANCVARWNGKSWSPIGSGASGVPGNVYTLAVKGSDLYVGGAFTTVTTAEGVSVPANHIAKWNGSGWSTLGSGAGRPVPGDAVYALAVIRNDLYVNTFANYGALAWGAVW
jgi:hypothetical protein